MGPPSLGGANGCGGRDSDCGIRFSSRRSWTDETTESSEYTGVSGRDLCHPQPSDAMSASLKRPGRNHVTFRMALSTVLTVLTLSMSSCSYAATTRDMAGGEGVGGVERKVRLRWRRECRVE